MKRSDRLLMVLDLADKDSKKAAEILEKARQQLSQEERKLEDLRHYYQEYEKIFTHSQTSVRAQDIARQRTFLGQLSQAQQQQHQIIEQRRQVVATKQKNWQFAYLKQKAIGQLIDRLRKDENLALTRKEEKRLDEWSLQASVRRSKTEQ